MSFKANDRVRATSLINGRTFGEDVPAGTLGIVAVATPKTVSVDFEVYGTRLVTYGEIERLIDTPEVPEGYVKANDVIEVLKTYFGSFDFQQRGSLVKALGGIGVVDTTPKMKRILLCFEVPESDIDTMEDYARTLGVPELIAFDVIDAPGA